MNGPSVWRGSVLAGAYLLDGAASGRRRALELWVPGARLLDLAGRLLLVLPSAVRVRCDRAPGLPFVRLRGRLVALPLPDAELESAPADAVVWREAGELRVEAASGLSPVDAAAWLDPGPIAVLSLAPRAAVAVVPTVALPPPTEVDARGRLGVPGADPQAEVVRRLLAAGRPGVRPASGPGWRARLAAAFARWRSDSSPSAAAAFRPVPRWRLALDALLARALERSRLARMLGRRHARYLRDMLDMFERGAIDEALRHAIPLGGDVEEQLRAWGVPRPRGSLALTFQRGGSARAWAGSPDLLSLLHRTYRSACERLQAQGRIDEAAFVLVELLRADAEAVQFLEKHGRLRLAAELAEARRLPPGIQVRQWFLAGDRARALQIALRHGAFADAAVRLEKGGRTDESDAWRLLWADALSDAGDVLGAAEVVAQVPQARSLALGWLDLAIAQEGPAGARALVRRLGLDPAGFERVRDAARALLADARAESLSTRLAFAEAVSVGARMPELSALARMAARALVRDAGRLGSARVPRKSVDRVIAVAADGALRADVPALPAARGSGLAKRGLVLDLDWPAADGGRLPVRDAAFLPNGRVALALGETGVRVLQRDGRTVAHFDQPAHRLVVSDGGERLIGLAPRGEVQRLARFDLARRRAESWWETPVGAHATSYDGRLWFVGVQADLYAIDAAGAGFASVWRAPEVEALAIARTADRLHVIGWEEPRGFAELFDYELPSLTLRSRDAVPSGSGAPRTSCVDASGSVISIEHREGLSVLIDGGREVEASPLAALAGLSREWLALACPSERGVAVTLFDRAELQPRLRATLSGAASVSVRIAGAFLTLADDRGRVVVFDLVDGEVVRDLRVGA